MAIQTYTAGVFAKCITHSDRLTNSLKSMQFHLLAKEMKIVNIKMWDYALLKPLGAANVS